MILKLKRSRIIILGLSLLICARGYSQKDVSAEGSFSMRIEKNMTEEIAQIKAIEQARINAIRSVFGDVIIQGNSTYIQNKSGEKIETQNIFNFYSDTYVNGEWIKDLKDPEIKKTIQNNESWITANVKCLVRSLKPTSVNFDANPSSCPQRKCITVDFNDNQDFFLILKSPVKGSLSVYLDVPSDQITYRILPYKKYSTLTSIEIEADKEYIFFSKNHDYFKDVSGIDELELTLTNPNTAEINKLFMLFSPNSNIDKPLLNNNPQTSAQINNVRDNYTIPSYLSSEDFQKWLQQIRGRNKDIEFKSSYINIRPSR